MKIHSYIKCIMFCFVAALLLPACQKADFMPEPVGEAVPAPAYAKLLDALNAPEYSLFRTAWQKAGMEKILQDERPQGKFTFLVPNNQAMQTAGFTESTINTASVKVLSDLLRYHVLVDPVTLEQLSASGADLLFHTMLSHPRFLEGFKKNAAEQSTLPYRYQHSLIANGTDMIANGNPLKALNEIHVSGGEVIVIDRVLTAPAQQMIDVLKADGRFSLFLKAMQISDEAYGSSVMMNYDAVIPAPYSFLIDWNYFYEGTFHTYEVPRHVIRFTLLAPTDAAFRELGINNEADLRALNNRVPDPGYYDYVTRTPLDSLLYLQKIGRGRMQTDIDWNTFVAAGAIQKDPDGNNAVFYQHSLRNNLLDKYIIRSSSIGGGAWQNYYIDMDFGKDANGHVTVKPKGSSAAPAAIVDANINTIQGPIHVVDHILVPKGFSMWHK